MDPEDGKAPEPFDDVAPVAMEVEVSSQEVALSTGSEVPVEGEALASSCSGCRALQKELEDCKRDRAFFVDIKRKMILTDTLIQKHQSKCQAFDEQQKKLQEVTLKLAQSKRDCRVLEDQLAATLKDIIPWKRDKERFLQELQDSKTHYDDLQNKVTAHESTIKQYQNKLDQCEEEKAVLESDALLLKSQCEELRSKEKKATASLEKMRESYSRVKRDASMAKRSQSSLQLQFERAQARISSLTTLLLRHGIKPPRQRRQQSSASEKEEEFMDDSDSSAEEEGDSRKLSGVNDKPPAPQKRARITPAAPRSRPSAAPSSPPSPPPPSLGPQPVHPSSSPPQPPGNTTPVQRKPWPKMNLESLACLSPLPPSPEDVPKDNAESSEDDDDDALTETAAKIDARLANKRHGTREEAKRTPPLRVSPRRRTGKLSNTRVTESVQLKASAAGRESCRELRSGKKLPQREEPGIAPRATVSKASKKLDLSQGEDVHAPRRGRKPGRGRKQVVNEKERKSDSDLDIKDKKPPVSHRLQRQQVQTLTSSEDEPETEKQEGMQEKGVKNFGMQTRGRAKGQAATQQTVAAAACKSTMFNLDDDLNLSSDGESRHSEYDPKDSDSLDDNGIRRGRRRRTDKIRPPQRKSVISESSDSEDIDRQNFTPNQFNDESVTESKLLNRSTAARHDSIKEQVFNDTEDGANGVGSDRVSVEEVSDGAIDTHENGGVSSRRMTRLQKHLQGTPPNRSKHEKQRKGKLSSGDEVSKSKHVPSHSADRGGGNASDANNSTMSDGKEAAECKTFLREELESSPKRLTRQEARKLLRSLSSPPLQTKTPCPLRGEPKMMLLRSSSRDMQNEECLKTPKRTEPMSTSSAPCRTNSLQNDTQNDRLPRNLSSPARLTRSALRKMGSVKDSNAPLHFPAPGAEPSSVSKHGSGDDRKSPERCRKDSAADPSQRKRLASRKRSHSECHSSGGDESDKQSAPSKVQSVSAETPAEDGLKVEEQNENDTSSKSDVKVLMRSETEEFVACMDDQYDVPIEHITQDDGLKEEVKPPPASLKDSPHVKKKKKKSKKRKTKALSCKADNEFAERALKGDHHTINNTEAVSVNMDVPGTSRGSASGQVLRSGVAMATASPRLVSESRMRQSSTASLPSSERDSPVSPIQEPFQNFACTRPISPMSPERPVERVSPIMPSFFFDMLPVPRMVSPLPPSPPRLSRDEPISDDGVGDADVPQAAVEVLPEEPAQPRMISPLFPTPVPFAVSPLHEIPVPPAISPIADVQQPPLGVQVAQAIATGKSPQLPSPRNFHSVAPLDAITVRPQHSSPGQSQERCTAMRSLNAALAGGDSSQDPRSSFSKKLIARRSSADEALKKPEDSSQNQERSENTKRNTGSDCHDQASNHNVLPVRVDYKEQSQPQETSVKLSDDKNSSAVSVTQKEHNPSGDSRKDHVEETQPQVSVSKAQSDFSEHLRRVNGHEEVTAFSRVIPHRDDSRPVGTIGKLEGMISDLTKRDSSSAGSHQEGGPAASAVSSRGDANCSGSSQSRPETTDAGTGKKEQEADSGNQPRRPEGAARKVTKIGSLWGQMARYDRNKFVRSKKRWQEMKGEVVHPDDPGSRPPTEDLRSPEFKVPAQPTAQGQAFIQDQFLTRGQDHLRTKEQAQEPFTVSGDLCHTLPMDVETQDQSTLHNRSLGGEMTIQEDHQKSCLTSNTPGSTSAADQDQSLALNAGPTSEKAVIAPQLQNILSMIKSHKAEGSGVSVCECILEFLQDNSMDLFSAIYSKCQLKSMTISMIATPEENKIARQLAEWTHLNSSRRLIQHILGELGRRIAVEGLPSKTTKLTQARLFAAICRESGWLARGRVLCYDIIREGIPHLLDLLLAMAAVWPTLLRRKDGAAHPMTATMEAVIMHQLHDATTSRDRHEQYTAEKFCIVLFSLEYGTKMSNCFSHLCKWRPLLSEEWQQSHIMWLIGLIRDKSSSIKHSDDGPRLSPRCYEAVMSLELVASCLGWEWTNNWLIREQLWPILKDWSRTLKEKGEASREIGAGLEAGLEAGQDETDHATVTACAVMKTIGNVSQIGLASSPASVQTLMKILIGVLQQPSESIPWPMQIFTAQAICDLSPCNLAVASEALAAWSIRPLCTIPRPLAGRIAQLGKVEGESARAGEGGAPSQS
ncbi:uncharacterized protein [Diadema antillarum]|uniref:uncharacterized protein n=1 Tax=Diadema antillarum TaxID=105358 RepID=UPI003A8A8DFE